MKTRASLLMTAVLALPACEKSAEPPPRAPLLPAPAPTSPVAAKSPTRGVVQISENIRKACGISDADSYFAFDSSLVRATDQPVLQKLATCFETGPLKGRQMRLVGHADPRGDEEYNVVLGGSRAAAVKSYLVQLGMPDRIAATSSRGEMDARGTDEKSWAEDRRVDVLLVD